MNIIHMELTLFGNYFKEKDEGPSNDYKKEIDGINLNAYEKQELRDIYEGLSFWTQFESLKFVHPNDMIALALGYDFKKVGDYRVKSGGTCKEIFNHFMNVGYKRNKEKKKHQPKGTYQKDLGEVCKKFVNEFKEAKIPRTPDDLKNSANVFNYKIGEENGKTLFERIPFGHVEIIIPDNIGKIRKGIKEMLLNYYQRTTVSHPK